MALRTPQKCLLIKGYCAYLLYQYGLRIFPNRWLLAVIKHKQAQTLPTSTKLELAEASEIFSILNWRLAGMQACLCRAWVAYFIFRACGQPLHFCYGVNAESEVLLAHSWVELASGEVLSDLTVQPKQFSTILKI